MNEAEFNGAHHPVVHSPHTVMRQTRSTILAQEMAACDLIERSQVLQAKATIAGLLFSNPEMDDTEVYKAVFAHTGINF